jgi:hypothetical protein
MAAPDESVATLYNSTSAIDGPDTRYMLGYS